MKTERDDSNTAFILRFSDNSGERILFERDVSFDQFDNNGNLYLQVTHDFYAAGVEFSIIPETETVLELRRVSYRITP